MKKSRNTTAYPSSGSGTVWPSGGIFTLVEGKYDSFNISATASSVMEEGPKSHDFIAMTPESMAIRSPTDAETLPKSSSTSFSNSNAEAEASMHSSKRAPQPMALTPRRWR